MARGLPKPGSSRDTIHDEGEGARTNVVETLPSSSISLEIETDDGEDDDSDLDAFGDLKPGAKLGRYQIDGVLGKGATGVVFLASHLVIGKRVALKCLYPQHSTSRNAVERFFREAKIAATVEHPNVIQVFDGGREKDVLYLAMERLEGESLADRIDRGKLSVDDALDLFLAIMDGVSAVHERGVVHRDLKPDNIFLVASRTGGSGIPKVLDFGISKLKEPGLRELTTLGTVMGTPFYMAPEQVTNSRDVDARADVYSLGVMLYEALVGDVPYAEESVIEIFRRAQAGDAPPLERERPDVPAPVVRVVEKAMRPDRKDRFASVSDMRDALATARAADTKPSRERPSALPEEDRRATVADLPPAPDNRETIADVMSPLHAPPPLRIEEAVTPHSLSAREDPAERPTLALLSAPPLVPMRVVPEWTWWALGVAAAVTFVSIVVAITALATS